MPARLSLTKAQRYALLVLPDTEEAFVRHYSLTGEDVEIIGRYRTPETFDKSLGAIADDGQINATYTGQGGYSSRAEHWSHPPRVRRQSARYGPCRAFWFRRRTIRARTGDPARLGAVCIT